MAIQNKYRMQLEDCEPAVIEIRVIVAVFFAVHMSIWVYNCRFHLAPHFECGIRLFDRVVRNIRRNERANNVAVSFTSSIIMSLFR